jgi:cytochrome b subunit of formate dehydrogenase
MLRFAETRDRPRLLRFVLVERLAHWAYAGFFVLAFLTGIVMWIPRTRILLGGNRLQFSHLHAGMGVLMVGIPLVLFLVLDRRRLAADIRQVDVWDEDDRRWFWAALRGGTVRRRRNAGGRGGWGDNAPRDFGENVVDVAANVAADAATDAAAAPGGFQAASVAVPTGARTMPPQGRFNAGQKFMSVLVCALALGFLVTGILLLERAHLPAWLVSRTLYLHVILMVAAVALLLAHVSHVIFTRHGRDSLTAIIRGSLSEETAREHYEKWWRSETGSGQSDS